MKIYNKLVRDNIPEIMINNGAKPVTKILEDKEYYYPNSTILVNNADKSYLGKIPLIDALGYSRNTCAVSTLEKVISKIGQEKVVEYLSVLKN